MTQAEKTAKELFNHYYDNEFSVIGFLGKEDAKTEAKFVVDEILNNERNTTMHPNDKIMNYWQEVKQAINKL